MVKYADNPGTRSRSASPTRSATSCKALGVDAHKVMDIFCQDQQAQPLAVLPQARLRLRRLVPAEGRARAALQGEDARRVRCRSSRRSCRPTSCRSSAASRRWWRRANEGRHPRLLLQGRHRRPAREPDGGAGRAPDRQGLRPARLRPATCSLARIHGANQDYILNQHPAHLAPDGADIDEVLAHAQHHRDRQRRAGIRRRAAPLAEGQTIVDFVRICDSRTDRRGVRGHLLVDPLPRRGRRSRRCASAAPRADRAVPVAQALPHAAHGVPGDRRRRLRARAPGRRLRRAVYAVDAAARRRARGCRATCACVSPTAAHAVPEGSVDVAFSDQ